MYITNISFAVEPTAQTAWLKMMKDKFIPLLAANGFQRTTFCRVLSIEAVDHFTYSLQVEIEDMDRYKRFSEDMLSEYEAIADPIFKSSVLWFHSLMKRI